MICRSSPSAPGHVFYSAGLALLVFVVTARPACGQDVGVTGVVLDASTGEPLGEVLIAPMGEHRPAVTGLDGGFRMELPSEEEYVLLVTRLGYQSVSRLYPPAIAGEHIVIELTPDPIELEGLDVFVDDLNRRFQRRRNSSQGLVRAYEATDLLALGADNGFDVFYKLVRRARPCPGAAFDYCIVRWGRDIPISVCIDDRSAWGGVTELADYRPEELYVIEVYNWGATIKAYTRWWVQRGAKMRQLPPEEWGCY
jgi:hypothetical protein